jgi:IS4 transposase
VGKTKRGKGAQRTAVADRAGCPLAVYTASATPHEITLVPETLAATFSTELPERLIGDKADDSDPPDGELAKAGIELIAPHWANRKKPATQDGRPLRCYRRRWQIERLLAWLQNCRRLVVRHERHAENLRGFVHLGCIIMLLRCYL